MAGADSLNMAELEREHREWIADIVARNQDLEERMRVLGVSVAIDEEDDALFLTIGPPTEALTESIDGLFYLRVEPDTLKVVGVEVWGFSTALQRVAGFLVHALHAAGSKVHIESVEPSAASAQLAQDIRELAAV